MARFYCISIASSNGEVMKEISNDQTSRVNKHLSNWKSHNSRNILHGITHPRTARPTTYGKLSTRCFNKFIILAPFSEAPWSKAVFNDCRGSGYPKYTFLSTVVTPSPFSILPQLWYQAQALPKLDSSSWLMKNDFWGTLELEDFSVSNAARTGLDIGGA